MAELDAPRPIQGPPVRQIGSTRLAANRLHRRLIVIPRAASPLIVRQAVADFSMAEPDRPLTLVCAPFGYGKTTFGIQLASASTVPAAWLTIEPEIDEPEPFLDHLRETIRAAVGDEVWRTPANLEATDLMSAGGTLADSLMDSNANLLLVIDEAHRITHPDCLQILTDLIVHAPGGVHIVLMGRSAPNIPLSLLRLKGLVSELGPPDLSLTSGESIELAQLVGSRLDPTVIETLRLRTSGWIGGLRLALAESLPAAASADNASIEIPGMESLADDILADFDPVTARFIASLSIVEEFGLPLAEALAAPDIGPEVPRSALASLARLGYLLDSSREDGRWWSIHPAILQSLRRRFREDTQPVDRQAIHQRAYRWFERSGRTREAIVHALEAGLPVEACEALERTLSEHLDQEDWRALEALLRAIPEELRNQRPRLLLGSAWVSHLSGRSEPIWEIEQRALSRFSLGASSTLDASSVLAEFTLLKLANSIEIEREPEAAVESIRAARESIPTNRRLARGNGYLLEGWALGCSGRVDTAIVEMNQATARESDVIDACSIRPLLGLVFAYRGGGHLAACEKTAEDAVALALDHNLPVSAGWAAMFSGLMAYEQDHLDIAQDRLALVEQNGHAVHLLSLREAMFCLAMTRLALGDPDGALATVNRLRDLVLDRHASGIMPGIRSFEARLALQMGNLGAVRAWLASSPAVPPPVQLVAFEHEALTRAKSLIAVGGPGEQDNIRRLIDGMRERAARASQRSAMIEVLAVSAIAHHAAGDMSAALTDLGESLRLAGSEGYRRTFLELGDRLEPLMRRIEKTASPDMAAAIACISSVQAYAAGFGSAATFNLRSANDRSSIFTILTIREAEVLERLTRRLTNAEIADEMSISLQTVKSHAANIYGKLGVNSRREAIIAAEAYDLSGVDPSHGKGSGQPRASVPRSRS